MTKKMLKLRRPNSPPPACLIRAEDKPREDVACEVNNMANEKTKPVKKFKAGAIDAAVWRNVNHQGKDGDDVVSYSLSMERRYKDKEGEWQGTNTFRANDLPKAALVLAKAYEFITMHADEEIDAESKDGGDVK